jgi:hypothetical protein
MRNFPIFLNFLSKALGKEPTRALGAPMEAKQFGSKRWLIALLAKGSGVVGDSSALNCSSFAERCHTVMRMPTRPPGADAIKSLN